MFGPGPEINAQWLVVRGEKERLLDYLQKLATGQTELKPTMSVREALEGRRRQFQIINKREWAALLDLSIWHYSRVINGHKPITLNVIRRAWALGVPIEPLLERAKPRTLFFNQ